MANRHLSRSIVLQTLFEWDFNGQHNENVPAITERVITEFGPGLDDNAFIASLVDLVITKQKIIDEIIEKAAPDWPIEKISIIDRNILRTGLCELLFGDRDQVPPKVAINEAIELAKTFGGENSSKFINGVLGAVYKEIGEPGKEQVSKKKKNDVVIDLATLPIEKKGGAVVFARHDGKVYFALEHDVFGYWTLAKGGIPAGMTEEEGTAFKVKEEIGIAVSIQEKLGENEYVASHPEHGKIRKQVSYFLAEAEYGELKLKESGGLDDVRWFPMEEVADLKMYDDIFPLIGKSVEILTSTEALTK